MKLKEKYPRFIRWTHWVNYPALMIMIWSGIMIYWANPAYITLPDSFYERFNLNANLAYGLSWHFLMMWVFTLNGIIYVTCMLLSGKWREITPLKSSFKDALQVALHDLKIRKEPLPKIKGLNCAQRISYTLILLSGAGSVLTGIAILKPVSLGWLTEIFGGYEIARGLHFLLMLVFIAFFFVHVLQVIRAGWNTFRAMIAGYEIETD